MADIRHLTKEDLNGRRGDFSPGKIVLRHLDGPALTYTLTRWHKSIGDRVRVHDIVATVETTDFTMDIEVVEEGEVAEHFFTVGSPVPNGATIALISSVKKAEPKHPPKPSSALTSDRGSS